MGYTTSTEYETAQSHASQLSSTKSASNSKAIATSPEGSTDVDNVIAEQDKSFFIFQAERTHITAYRDRDVHDDRATLTSPNLKEELTKAKIKQNLRVNAGTKEYVINQQLKSRSQIADRRPR